jgi:3'-phosphoadenosine 5'-phosphosulfate sulfotransferase (PAPS reductase)/FAD synthetase
VTRKELDEATKEACDGIREHTRAKLAAYTWSGGKDSLVTGDLCRKLGITRSVFVHSDLEYPAFLRWCLDNLPEGCEAVNTGQDLDWLKKHPAMLFPGNAALASRWFGIVQRAGIAQFYRKNGLDILVEGHRKADCNYVGKGGNVHANASGLTRYSPLADWPHEMVLAYIAYHKLPMPPIYGWKDGYRCGTHPWPARSGMKSLRQGWQEVFDIDPEIVRQAAEQIDSAAGFLMEVGA